MKISFYILLKAPGLNATLNFIKTKHLIDIKKNSSKLKNKTKNRFLLLVSKSLISEYLSIIVGKGGIDFPIESNELD